MRPSRVWATMDNGSAHLQNQGFRHNRSAEINLASYSAHFLDAVAAAEPRRQVTSENPHRSCNAGVAVPCGPKLVLVSDDGVGRACKYQDILSLVRVNILANFVNPIHPPQQHDNCRDTRAVLLEPPQPTQRFRSLPHQPNPLQSSLIAESDR